MSPDRKDECVDRLRAAIVAHVARAAEFERKGYTAMAIQLRAIGNALGAVLRGDTPALPAVPADPAPRDVIEDLVAEYRRVHGEDSDEDLFIIRSMVQAAKGTEAHDINELGLEAQLDYLVERQTDMAVLRRMLGLPPA